MSSRPVVDRSCGVAGRCAARQVDLTRGGAMVREGSADVRGGCEFLGIVEANDDGARVRAVAAGAGGGLTGDTLAGTRVSGSATKLRTIIRNEVAELGGDVFVIAAVERFEVQAEAYRCFR